jgi:hypothetical protein
MPLVVISVLFGLSLLGAYVLFKILQSTATVTKPEYQLGGAAAGFVVILTIVSVTYVQVDDKKQRDDISDLQRKLNALAPELEKGKTCLAETEKDFVYGGTVSPSIEEANVMLVISAVKLQDDGKFQIKVRHVKPTDGPSLYVIGGSGHTVYKQVFDNDDPTNLTIKSH